MFSVLSFVLWPSLLFRSSLSVSDSVSANRWTFLQGRKLRKGREERKREMEAEKKGREKREQSGYFSPSLFLRFSRRCPWSFPAFTRLKLTRFLSNFEQKKEGGWRHPSSLRPGAKKAGTKRAITEPTRRVFSSFPRDSDFTT